MTLPSNRRRIGQRTTPEAEEPEFAMHVFRRLAPLAALILLAGCAASATPTPAGDGGGEGGGGAEGTTVTISGSSFGDDITVPAGTSVTFVNEDSLPHTVTNGSDGQPEDGALFDNDVAAGASTEVTFDEPGTYNVTCTIHPSMNMTVTVEG
jgi:plastocyanin